MTAAGVSGIYRWTIAVAMAGTVAISPKSALADQGGVSFWVPGLFGSLAAVPQQPGFNFVSMYYHTSVDAGGSLAAAKQIEVGRLNPVKLNLKVNLDIDLKARADLGLFVPGYVFETKIFGGQFAISMMVPVGKQTATLDGTLSASLGPLTVTRQGSITDSASGFGDLFPQASLRWNSGLHNLMIYGTTNIRVGTYEPTRLANLGLGFNGWDGGVGYTYFDPTKGHEFSATAGLTYNNWNHDTNYKNGLDFHVDFGASQFLNKQFFVGAVGYIYQQLEPDIGSPAFLGEVKSRVYGIGPQMGYIFQAAPGVQGYLNFKGYYEFDSHDRPEGWNVWATLAFSPAEKQAQKPVSTPRPQWK
jgi:hypothetical protein